MAYLATAMSGAFLIFWQLGNEKIHWVKLIIYSFLFALSLFLTLGDILQKEQSAKDHEALVIREIREDHHKIRLQIDSVRQDLDSLRMRKDSLEVELRRRR